MYSIKTIRTKLSYRVYKDVLESELINVIKAKQLSIQEGE